MLLSGASRKGQVACSLPWLLRPVCFTLCHIVLMHAHKLCSALLHCWQLLHACTHVIIFCGINNLLTLFVCTAL
jgi:hypothetical protein